MLFEDLLYSITFLWNGNEKTAAAYLLVVSFFYFRTPFDKCNGNALILSLASLL